MNSLNKNKIPNHISTLDKIFGRFFGSIKMIFK